MAKRLIVSGAAGFIGSALVRQWVERGDRVVVLDKLTYAGMRANLDGLPGVEIVEGDIADGGLARALLEKHRPEAWVNLAAESHVDRSISGPAAFIQTNIVGTFALLEANLKFWQGLEGDERASFRFLQVSTDEVFGSLVGNEGRFNEESPYAPNSPYSASKAGGDHLVRAWHRTYGLPTLLTNCSNNYGPRQHPEKLIPNTIRAALAGNPIPVYGTGKNQRDWIHVDDHSRGIRLALERGEPGSSYCFGGEQELENLELVGRICAILDRLRPRADGAEHASAIRFVKDRLGHDHRYAIDHGFAKRTLGFQNEVSFEAGLEATVAWYLANPTWVELAVRGEKK